jgi:hypothetical protein
MSIRSLDPGSWATPVVPAVDSRQVGPYTLRGAGRYPSGQRGLTVDQLAECLRRFESFPPHHIRHPAFFTPTLSCGSSSMVECQPSKLAMRVRFPSPAPPSPSVAATIRVMTRRGPFFRPGGSAPLLKSVWQFKEGAFWLARVVAHARTGSRAYWLARALAHAVGTRHRSRHRPTAATECHGAPTPGSPRIHIGPACPRLFAPTASPALRSDPKAQARANPWGGPGSANKLARNVAVVG